MARAPHGSFQWLAPFISSLSRSLSPFPPSQTVVSLTQYTEAIRVTWCWCSSLSTGRKYTENVLAEPWEDPGGVSAAESVCWAWGDSDLFHCCPDAEQVTGGRDGGGGREFHFRLWIFREHTAIDFHTATDFHSTSSLGKTYQRCLWALTPSVIQPPWG